MRFVAQLEAFDDEQRVLNLFFYLCPFQVAIKSIRKEKIKDEQDMVHIRREIEIMSSLRHPHIISIYEGEGLQRRGTHTLACTCKAQPRMPVSFCQISLHPELARHSWPGSRIVML